MIRGKFDQARCDNCQSWHFALQLDENREIIEVKCCRCGRLEKITHMKRVDQEQEIKNESV